MAMDKPAGLAVHGGSGISYGLIERLRQARPEARFLELVHRLDRDTSGILLVAKKRAALVGLHAQLREGQVDKRYLVLVRGKWRDAVRAVELSLTKFVTGDGERRVRVEREGRSARTVFRLLRKWPDAEPPMALLEAELDTGRTHQIRVHLTHVGFPLAGDDKYGDFAWNRTLVKQGLKRMFLHAHRSPVRPPGDRRGDFSRVAAAARPLAIRRAPRRRPGSRRQCVIAVSRRFRFVVFDWDGTLADSTGLIARSIQEACRDIGEPVPDEATARYVIGLGLAEMLHHITPGLAPGRHRELTDRYRHHYLGADASIPLFDGVAQLLDELDAAGCLLGVATGKSRVGLARAFEQHRDRAPVRGHPLRRRGLPETESRHVAASHGSSRRGARARR